MIDSLENYALNIISHTGMAKSLYFEATTLVRNGNIEGAYKKIEEGKKLFLDGHRKHAELITHMANGDLKEIDLLLVHAEDQMACAELMEQMALQILYIYEVMLKNDLKL